MQTTKRIALVMLVIIVAIIDVFLAKNLLFKDKKPNKEIIILEEKNNISPEKKPTHIQPTPIPTTQNSLNTTQNKEIKPVSKQKEKNEVRTEDKIPSTKEKSLKENEKNSKQKNEIQKKEQKKAIVSPKEKIEKKPNIKENKPKKITDKEIEELINKIIEEAKIEYETSRHKKEQKGFLDKIHNLFNR
ncbi:hypothetical protein [Persephonella sp. IF05-L8]|uniref:hypothetical protein n=1 Tax=Persephonella sp. IF05-L8 TaxID=1158338 RepID=UPI0004970D91